jgi:hypothetical protein
MGFGLNISQPATSGTWEALTQAYTTPMTTQIEAGNFNLGEILKSYVQGSPENGGADVAIQGRLAASTGGGYAAANSGLFAGEKPMLPFYIIGGLVVLGVVFFAGRKMR